MLRQHLNVVIFPAPDVPGQWISHCLEIDFVSLGNDPEQALDMMAEAIALCAAENVKDGRPPIDFRSAPRDAWELCCSGEPMADRLVHLAEPATHITLAPLIVRAR